MERNLSVQLRPKRFEDLIGMEYVVEPILEGLRQGRVDSAYMFSGQPGTGKTTIAWILAKYIQNNAYSDEEFDIEEINTAFCNTAEDARELVQRAKFNPWTGKYKVIILDECQRLTPAAQQILLKDMEEPNDRLVWIPCTSEPAKISSALQRRCVQYHIKGLSAEDTSKLLTTYINKLEKSLIKEYLPRVDELTNALVLNQIVSPGFIVRALEKFITGIPASEAALVATPTSVDALAICRAVVKGDWNTTKGLLLKAQSDEGRIIRNIVAGYFKSILLKADRPTSAKIAAEAIHELASHSTFEDGLILSSTIASLYKICEITKKRD